jgi:glycosyltransferase involved in cell wall biosynthesis
MRILYHHRTLADGAEGIHIAEMVSAFRELGHAVRVIGLVSPATARRGVVARVRTLLTGPAHELAGVACNAREYLTVRSAIDEFRPDVMYKRHGRNDVAALSAARSRRLPVALEVNCLYASESYRRFEPLTFRRLAAAMELHALSLATVVLPVSTPLAAQIRALGVGNVHVLPNGANPVTFRPVPPDLRAQRDDPGMSDGLTLGWAGIIRDWHGLELLLDVLSHVPKSRLLVVGDGPGRTALQSEAARRAVANRLIITGRVPHASMSEYLRTVDIAVVADERTGVASPMKLLEYMSMGLTVVAPDLPNIRDLVANGVDGVLFRPEDGQDLTAAIITLAENPRRRRALGAAARLKIEEERNWKRNATTVLELLVRPAPADRAHPEAALGRQHV